MNYNKKAAIELSIGTIVIIVLAMAMLVLGIVLVQKIFSGATNSVSILDDKVQAQIQKIFGDESKDVVVFLGPDKTAKVKAGSDNFGIAIGAKTPDGSTTDRKRLQYKISLDESDRENCVKALGKTNTEKLFKQETEQWVNFDEYSGDSSYAIVIVSIPKGTALCTQKVMIDVKDTVKNQDVGGAFFILDVQRSGLF